MAQVNSHHTDLPLSSVPLPLNVTPIPSPQLLDFNPSATQILRNIYHQPTAAENALLQPVLNTLLSVPRAGEPFNKPTFANDGDIYPVLETTMQQIWNTLLARDRDHRKLKILSTDIVAPHGSFQSALLVMAHYPPSSMESPVIYDPAANRTALELLGKLGIEQVSGQSKVEQHGAFVFDACPMKKPIMRTYNYNTDHIPRHYRQYIDSMWTRSTSRVGIVLGRIPDVAFADVFRDRIRLVAQKVYRSIGDIHYVNRVYFMYANADDMDANRIQRVVFKTCHLENFQRGCSFSDDASRSDSGHHMNDRLLACEQFIDAATFLAVGQVPRPMLLSHPAAYYRLLSVLSYPLQPSLNRMVLLRQLFCRSSTHNRLSLSQNGCRILDSLQRHRGRRSWHPYVTA
jgi:hypothetical protein